MDKKYAAQEAIEHSMMGNLGLKLIEEREGLFGWVASTVGLVERGAAVLLALSDNPWALLFLINVILLAAGMIMDAISIYYVLLPFLLPIVHHFAWDPVWFGVMMTVNLAVGQVTPPVAVNLYVGAQIADLTSYSSRV